MSSNTPNPLNHPPELSIIIPTHNRESLLEETLARLFACELGDMAFEVIVVNDGTPFSRPLARFNQCRLAQNGGRGAAAARNLGASLAKSSLLLFLDDDMLLSNGSLHRHIQIHAQFPGIALSGIWQYNPEVELMLGTSCFGRYKLKNDYRTMIPEEIFQGSPVLRRAEHLASFNLSVSRNLFEKVGGFDANFKYAGCEDQEFSLRLAQSGVILLVATDLLALHNEKDRALLDNWLLRQYRGVQGVPLLARKHPGWHGMGLYTENSPVSPGDGPLLALRKTVKILFYNRFWKALLLFAYWKLERISALERVNHYIIRRLEGIQIFLGFREGLKSLWRETAPETTAQRPETGS